ncbi:hypothetical protein GCM10025734_60650 [Kitasatospora paranensis]
MTNPSAGSVDARSRRVMGSLRHTEACRGSRCESGAVPPLSPGSTLDHMVTAVRHRVAGRPEGAFDPEARRLSPPVRRSRARTLSEDTHAMQAAQRSPFHHALDASPCHG